MAALLAIIAFLPIVDDAISAILSLTLIGTAVSRVQIAVIALFTVHNGIATT